ncbi:MAG: hypothetical protein AAGM16_12825 [Pseudomonadota bacterium]
MSYAVFYKVLFLIAWRIFVIVFIVGCMGVLLVHLLIPGYPPLDWERVKFSSFVALMPAGFFVAYMLIRERINLREDRKFYEKHLAKYTEEERQKVYRTQLRHLGLHDKNDD